MEIEIEKIGKIEKSKIEITENAINIKYGLNGTGKSTFAKCLKYKINNEEREIKGNYPYYWSNEEPIINIKTSKEFDGCEYFDQDYVNQYLFQDKSQVIPNSIEIIKKTKEYQKAEEKINEKFKSIKDIIGSELEEEIKKMEDIIIVKTEPNSKFYKGQREIPEKLKEELEVYNKFIFEKEKLVEKGIGWVEWFQKGKENYYNKGDRECPFCVKEFDDEDLPNKLADKLGKSTRFNNAIHANKTNLVLNEYFPSRGYDTKDKKNKIKEELNKITNLKNLNMVKFLKNKEPLKELKIEEDLYGQNYKYKETIQNINKLMEEIVNHDNELKKEIGEQKSSIIKLMRENKKFINDYLKASDIPYEFNWNVDEAQVNTETYLIPTNTKNTEYRANGKELSYGERNSISLMLFFLENIEKENQLLILDDPISSFDDNKKYSILWSLFRKRTNDKIKGNTILWLTHDLNTIIDVVYNEKFKNREIKCHFLYNEDKELKEKEIKREKIKSILNINKDDDEKNIVSRICSKRKLIEIQDGSTHDEYKLLSKILHLEEIKNNIEYKEKYKYIIKWQDELNSFLSDTQKIEEAYYKSNTLDKVAIVRLLEVKYKKENDGNSMLGENDQAIKKYIDEQYHIENSQIFTLCSNEYNLVPNNVIEKCDQIVKKFVIYIDTKK